MITANKGDTTEEGFSGIWFKGLFYSGDLKV